MLRALCQPGTRVLVYNGRKQSIAATVVGVGFHASTTSDDVQVSCIVQLDHPFDTEEGLYVRYLVVHPSEFEVLPH